MSDIPRIAPPPEGKIRPRISILTACYNALDPLRATLDSLAQQDNTSFEHVIADGGSEDGTRPLLETLHGAVTWVSEKDEGIGDALNKALSRCSGDWVLVLHAGDRLASPTSISDIESCLDTKADIITFALRYGGDNTYRTLYRPNPSRRLRFKAILHQATLCQRSLFEEIGGFDTSYRIGMDYEFFLRAKASGAKFLAVPKIISVMDDGGLSAASDWHSLRERFAEERKAQERYCSNQLMKIAYSVYWPAYLSYRWLRAKRQP